MIIRHLLARYAIACGCAEFSCSHEQTTEVKYTSKNAFLCERLFGAIVNIVKRYVSIKSNILTHYVGGIYENLLGHTALNSSEITVTRTQAITTSLAVEGLIQVDEVLIDSIEKLVARNEITQSSIPISDKNTTQIDFLGITAQDIHAAIIARKVIQISNHHFGRYWNLHFSRLYSIALSIALDYGLLQLSHRDQWSSAWYPWVTTLADISTFTKQMQLSQRLEYEADRGAVELAARAGYSPLGMLWLLEYQARRETATQGWWALLFGVSGGMFCSTPLNSRRQQALVKVMEQNYQSTGTGNEMELLL